MGDVEPWAARRGPPRAPPAGGFASPGGVADEYVLQR
jgi:hypothetical protein